MNTGYWISMPSTKIWFVFLMLSCITTWSMTLYFYSLKADQKELDMKVVDATYKAAANYCHKVKSRNFVARASGLEIQAGCGKMKR